MEAPLDADGALSLPPQVLRGSGNPCAADKLGLHELPPDDKEKERETVGGPWSAGAHAGVGEGSLPYGAALSAVQKPSGNIARLKPEASPTSHRHSRQLSKKPRFRVWTLKAQGRHTQRGRLGGPAPAGQKRGSRKTTKLRVSLT